MGRTPVSELKRCDLNRIKCRTDHHELSVQPCAGPCIEQVKAVRFEEFVDDRIDDGMPRARTAPFVAEIGRL